MAPNPVLHKLGFSDSDRLVILHLDDIGMCHASVQAFMDVYESGLEVSGAVMVPCPWFLEAARFAREHPQADLGVHLTLNSEHERFRWGPLTTRDPSSGLLDEEGFFPRTSQQTRLQAGPEAVQREIEAQVDRAEAAGMVPTHADTHMGTLADIRYVTGYARMAAARRLPVMLSRWNEGAVRAAKLPPEILTRAAQFMGLLEETGLPLIDNLVGMPLHLPEAGLDHAKQIIDGLPQGVTHFIFHPAVDTPELRAILPGNWQARVRDYRLLLDGGLRDYLRSAGIQVIGYRAVQATMPDPAPTLAALEKALAAMR